MLGSTSMRSLTFSKFEVGSTIKSSYKSPKKFIISAHNDIKDKRMEPMKDFYQM